MAPDIVKKQNVRTQESYLAWQRFQGPRNMKKESERLKTFINWTVSFLDSKKLAENGFYYTNTGDVVRCAFCDVQIGCWAEGDDPEADHRQNSPACPLFGGGALEGQGQAESGEETTEENKEEEVTSQDVCGLEIRPFSAPERPGKAPFTIESANLWRDFEELGVSKISGPVAPYYATYTSRLKTFETWPIGEIQSPEKLAEAGFYYTSFQDNVLCFHCGGGLKNWEVEDDPWVEHAKWFSKCGFVTLRKGREFITEVLAKERNHLATLHSKGSSEESSAEAKEKVKKEEPNPETKSVAPPSSSTSSSGTESQRPSSPNPEGKEIELCRICYTRERGIVFLPCGHFVSCTECAPSLSSCAVCRKPFEATVRAYLS